MVKTKSHSKRWLVMLRPCPERPDAQPDAACWQLGRSESEVWALLEGTEQVDSLGKRNLEPGKDTP